jgi:dihydrofolate reductase
MGKIVVSENVSLDGQADGARLFEYSTPIPGEVGQILLEEAQAAEALLLGRRGYEFFASRWPLRSGVYADRLNGMPKYVVSSTLEHPAWGATTVLRGGAVNEVRALKQRADGDIVAYGSLQLVHALMEHDLVDELRLLVYPAVLGEGRPLFGQTSGIKPLRLASTRTLADGIILLTYQPAPVRPQQ